MLSIYRLITYLVLLLSPIIILFRIFKNKEHPIRFLEKFSLNKIEKKIGKTIWFHGSSVGEILSSIPVIEKLEKKKNIKQILLTSNTLSSSKIIKKFKLKKTVHQFFPLDINFITLNFLNYWKPNLVIFLESEIWPNMLININKKKIPLILLNGRITKKSFKNWLVVKSISKKIFGYFDLCLAQNNETIKYLKDLGAKKIKVPGNLKFSESSIKIPNKISKTQERFLSKKNIIFCAVSTHPSEEIFCANLFKKLRKNKNSIIIIIPRHIDRSQEIKDELESLNLKVHLHSNKEKINSNTNDYLVNSYGETKFFLKYSKIVFMGGSLIPHGGQNPIEAARIGCKVLHGPYISNFKDVYSLLKKNKITKKIDTLKNAEKIFNNQIKEKNFNKKIAKKLKNLGSAILRKNLGEIEKQI